MAAYETLRRATLPMRQNPASAPCHSRGIVATGTPASPQILLVPHALGRPHTGAHVSRHIGTPFQGAETTPGSVAYIQVTNGGSGYTTPPTVAATGGVQAEAVLANGQVSYVKLLNAGSNFVSAPSVTFQGGGGSGAQAAATLPPAYDPDHFAQFTSTSTGSYDFLLFGD